MALGTSNINITSICSELGISVGNNRTFTSLTRHASINKWSFRRPGSISPNTSTKLIELTAPSNNDKLGDFREYNHSATAPNVEGDYTHKWGPGGATTDLQFTITPSQLNIKEIGYDYYTFKLYSSSANRASKTSPIKTEIVSIDYSAVSAPPGHTNNQTQKPDSPQVIDITAVSTSYSTIYMDSYISDISGNEQARFDDSYTDITMIEYEQPLMRATQLIDSGDLPAGNSPDGFPWTVTGSRFQIYTASTPKDSSSDVNQTFGSSSYSFYWTVVLADTNSNFYCAGVSSIDLRTYLDDGSMSHDQAIDTSTSNTDPTTQRQSSGTISGASFAYDDVWIVYYDIGSVTFNGVYSLI